MRSVMRDIFCKVTAMKDDTASSKEKGDKGESLAASFLEEIGYRIITKQWKFMRYELDIVAENKTHIVFVEVKTRYSNYYGEPWEAVNKAKRQKVCVSADAYIKQFNCEKEPRFDIVSIIHHNGKTEILHIEEAFYPMV